VSNNVKFNNEQKNTVPHCQLSLSRDRKKLVQYCRYHRHCLHQRVLFLDQKYQLSVDSKSQLVRVIIALTTTTVYYRPQVNEVYKGSHQVGLAHRSWNEYV